MSQRFNISVPRKKKDGGTYWVNIGTAWQDEQPPALKTTFPLARSDVRGERTTSAPDPTDGSVSPQ